MDNSELKHNFDEDELPGLGFDVNHALSTSKSGLMSLLKQYDFKPLIKTIPGIAAAAAATTDDKYRISRSAFGLSRRLDQSLDASTAVDTSKNTTSKLPENITTRMNSVSLAPTRTSEPRRPSSANPTKRVTAADFMQASASINAPKPSASSLFHQFYDATTPRSADSDDSSIDHSATAAATNSRFGQLSTIYKESTSVLPSVSSPLPLMNFSSQEVKLAVTAKTITNQSIHSVPNLLNPPAVNPSQPSEYLCDPIESRKISRWFVARSLKELNWRQNEALGGGMGGGGGGGGVGPDAALSTSELCMAQTKVNVCDVVVYESYLFIESPQEKCERDASKAMLGWEDALFQSHWGKVNYSSTAPHFSDPTCDQYMSFTSSLKFDGHFESGNIEKSTRVLGRETLLWPAAAGMGMGKGIGGIVQDSSPPGSVDQEYDITLRKDLNTNGNIQWYYFSVEAPVAAIASSETLHLDSQNATRSTPLPSTTTTTTRSAVSRRISYPLRVRFNIVNMQKNDSLYNYGMKPAVYSCNQERGEDWVHGGEDICYYRNGLTSSFKGSARRRRPVRSQYTLTFTYTFTKPDTVYFAHTYPYTYSDLQAYLTRLESNTIISNYFHRRILAKTLADNVCDMITITERTKDILESKKKPSIVITSRVHPGESNSSFMIHGLIDFLVSDAAEAVKLRKAFVFSIVPMLNPDGVIHGNYRTSLAGTDLNRRYHDPHIYLHPTIAAFKSFIQSTVQKRNVYLYLDLHGHSKLKNSFLYGCDFTLKQDKLTKFASSQLSREEINQRRIYARVFPRLLCEISNASKGGYFSYRDSSFVMDHSKFGTGRIVCWSEMGIPASYTIEASFCGNGDNEESKVLKRYVSNSSACTMDSSSSKYPSRRSAVTAAGAARRARNIKGKATGKSKATDANAGEDDAEDMIMNSEVDSLLERYQSYRHYSKRDILNMGRDIGRAIYHFSNLSFAKEEEEEEARAKSSVMGAKKNKSSSSRASILHLSAVGDSSSNVDIESEAIDNAAADDDELSDDELSESDSSAVNKINAAANVDKEMMEMFIAVKRADIAVFEADKLRDVLARPGVFSVSSIEKSMNSFPFQPPISLASTNAKDCFRAKCEYMIRCGLQLTSDIKLTGGDVCMNTPTEIGIEEENLSVNGSESDPSEDNAPANKMLKNMHKYKDTNNLVHALRKVMKKKRISDDLRELKAKEQNDKMIAKERAVEKKKMEELAMKAEKEAAAQLASSKEASEKVKTDPDKSQNYDRAKVAVDKSHRNSIYAFGSSAVGVKQMSAHTAAVTAAVTAAGKDRLEKAQQRKSSIFDSTPKRPPIIRQESEEIRETKTLQLKIINFQEYNEYSKPLASSSSSSSAVVVKNASPKTPSALDLISTEFELTNRNMLFANGLYFNYYSPTSPLELAKVYVGGVGLMIPSSSFSSEPPHRDPSQLSNDISAVTQKLMSIPKPKIIADSTSTAAIAVAPEPITVPVLQHYDIRQKKSLLMEQQQQQEYAAAPFVNDSKFTAAAGAGAGGGSHKIFLSDSNYQERTTRERELSTAAPRSRPRSSGAYLNKGRKL